MLLSTYIYYGLTQCKPKTKQPKSEFEILFITSYTLKTQKNSKNFPIGSLMTDWNAKQTYVTGIGSFVTDVPLTHVGWMFPDNPSPMPLLNQIQCNEPKDNAFAFAIQETNVQWTPSIDEVGDWDGYVFFLGLSNRNLTAMTQLQCEIWKPIGEYKNT